MKALIMGLMVLMFVAAGCGTTRTAEPERKTVAELTGKTNEQQAMSKKERKLRAVVDDADPLIANLIASINEHDLEKHLKDFDNQWKNANDDPARFERICRKMQEQLGTLQRYQINKIENQNPFYILHYWVKCSAVGDLLKVRLVLKREDGVLKVAFHSFKAPALQK